MNYSIIKEMFAGNRGNCDKIKQSERYTEIANEISGIIIKITASQNESERKALLTELNCLQGELEAEVASENYTEGFKTGLLVAFEANSEIKH